MFKTEDDILCPVKAWEYTVRRIRNTVIEANEDTPVCSYAEGMEVKGGYRFQPRMYEDKRSCRTDW